MRDLRRRALESNKTVSRKARSKQPSGANSTSHSRSNSRSGSGAVSRHDSDDEDGGLSDETSWSANSIDDLAALDDVNAPSDAWRDELQTRIDQLVDRKRSSGHGREDSLRAYLHILTAHFAQEVIHSRLGELVPALLKSVKADTSENETVAALKALATTMITEPTDHIYEASSPILRRTISDSASTLTKTAAVHTLGVLAFYGGASVEETEDVLATLLDIVESDGHSIAAGDVGDVVVAALEEWGFLATQVDDLEDVTEQAMEAFVDQLDSSDPRVQVAAGENIALLYEKSYTEREADEEAPSSEESDPEDETAAGAPTMVKRYTVYRREDTLKHTLQALANVSTRAISKKDRKTLHSNFADVLNSVEHPTRGPRYRNAVNQETGKRYGSRMTVRVHRTGEMRIDQWWKLHRLRALRRVLQGGFIIHYETNEVVFDSLPIMISKT